MPLRPSYNPPATALFVIVFAGLITFVQLDAIPIASEKLGIRPNTDLLRLSDIRKLAAPVASIGGADTFDGIFITGIVAVLLA